MTRTFIAFLSLMATLAVGCGEKDQDNDPRKPFFKGLPMPAHIAHRGGADLYPESTIYALQHVTDEYQTDVLEIDLVLSSDGHIMVTHDVSVEHTTDGTGSINDMTKAEIQALDAAYQFDPDGDQSYPLRGTGIVIPSLEEVFTAFPTAYYNLEIKDFNQEYEADLVALVDQFNLRERVLWGSANDDSAERLKALAPEVAMYYPTAAATCFVVAVTTGGDPFACADHYDALNVPEGAATADLVEAAHSADIAVYVWTINDRALMDTLLALGVDGIITDRPDLLRDAIDAL